MFKIGNIQTTDTDGWLIEKSGLEHRYSLMLIRIMSGPRFIVVQNGTMEPKIMFEAPFTNINTLGVAGVFGEEEGEKVIELVRHINENSGVAR